jgi:hypothetical protein
MTKTRAVMAIPTPGGWRVVEVRVVRNGKNVKPFTVIRAGVVVA